MINEIIECQEYSDLIGGFDMVNEEDVTPPIREFISEIFDGKRRDKLNSLPCLFHCGESHDRNNTNLFDAVLLDSKRIGHGFQLMLQPLL